MKSSNYLRRAKRKNQHPTQSSDTTNWQDKVIGKNHLIALLNIKRAELDLWLKQGMPVLRTGGFGREWEFDLIAVKAWAKSQHLSFSE